MPCPCRLCRVRNRFLLPGQSETVGGITISVTKTPVSKSTTPNDQRRRKKHVKQQVVRTIPTGDEEPDASPDPNQLHDNDLGEAMVAGLYAGRIQELDSSRVSVSSLNAELRRRIAGRVRLVERFGLGNS